MKITKKDFITVLKSIFFSMAYSVLSVIMICCYLYPYDPAWFTSEQPVVSVTQDLKSLELSKLCTVFHIIGAVSFILLIAVAILNYNSYYNEKNTFTNKHLKLEFLLYILTVFPLWKYGETVVKSIYNAAGCLMK